MLDNHHKKSINASVNSKYQHPPWADPRAENFSEITAPGQKIDKNPAPGDNFVDLQDNFAMIVKPFWYSSLPWLSSSFFKDYKACEYKISE